MTEPQVWAALGILAATFVGSVGALVVQVNRTITAQFAASRAEFKGGIGEVKAEIVALRAELKGDIQGLRNEISHLDRDVQTIARRVFGTESGD